MENPKKERCHVLWGKKERERDTHKRDTNESNGEIDIGVFRLGRASEWAKSGSIVIRCD